MKSITLFLEDLLLERSFRAKIIKRPASTTKSYAVAGKMRSLSKGTPLQQRIKRERLILKRLMDTQRRTLGSRARSAAMRG